ncbi:MAG: O-methyltransferase [Planctomycetes bacterium]|nr:O-methyltransferase [Planctomycetota bacterium]
MSESPTVHSAALMRYVAAHAAPEDPFLAELKAAAKARGFPAISVAPDQAVFMQLLLRLMRAREVVEVGTLGGYSAISMARGLLEGGRVRTIEVDPERAGFARDWAARSDVAGRVEVHEGPGAKVLPTLAASSADAAFLDADKESYGLYLEECRRIVRPGGLIMVDNAFAFGFLLDPTEDDPSVLAIRAFNETMRGARDLQGVIVPLGDGLWVAWKRW